MNLEALENVAFAFVAFALVFWPLERFHAYHPQRIFRKEWGTDLLFLLGQYLVWTSLSLWALLCVRDALTYLPLEDLHAVVRSQPVALQVVEVIVLCDVLIYWGHRLSHTVPFLWRFHRVHHTAPRLDWMAAYREHPLDNVYTRIIENFPALLLGFPLEILAGLVVFRGLWGLFIHSNAAISLGPLKYVLGSPHLHHWHHEATIGGRCNFANLMPIMDVLFGTYHDPREKPAAYGPAYPRSNAYVFQLLGPFLPSRYLRSR
ncbi:MAG: sterol desaturase family protein [Planctomycetes bacterium]|nr:sterol desaturase family protein [Planctomycetota bacterium]